MVYDAGPEAHEVLAAVGQAFLHDNALNTMAFPSLGETSPRSWASPPICSTVRPLPAS
ncbi:MAG: hypothetical protein ACR2JF_01765 [Iamia sp.]